MRKFNKFASIALSVAMVATMAVGCGNSDTKKAGGGKSADGKVTIKLFSNLTDRKNGQGLVEQTIIDEYEKENPNVTIEVEALDEEAYKTKFKAYSMSGMPDVVSIWGQPAFLDEVVEAGVLAELNQDDYKDYQFVEGSLSGYTYDGKLYGLPRNTDIGVFYYNQKMFEDNGWEVPKTYDELLELGKKINEKGIVPVAMDGGDGWPLCCYLADVLFKITGTDYLDTVSKAMESGDFSSDEMKKAAQLLKDAADANLFQKGYDTQDYGAAMNLFTNGQAAMFYMGSWETSMAVNEDIAEDIRTNIRVFTMPTVEGGKATATDISAWNGGGYAVSANSEVKEEAIKFLNYMYQPEKLSKLGWENGVGLSAQDQSSYMTGDETELQKQIVEILSNSTNLSGTPINDLGTSAFKTTIESEIQSVCNGSKSVDDFLSALGGACK
ncbi:MAG: extracellular solute-binding protein [Eubacterium sp.]|nr:extracellular solute-binding protein [Eubacterium sp.]